jgi:3-oxoacyl-[acyl-carrier-protein] synthase II
MIDSKRVVVTGIGIICPVGNNFESFSKNIFEGKTSVDYFDIERKKKAFFIKNFDDNFQNKKFGNVLKYSLTSSREAIENSGIKDFSSKKSCIFWGTSNGDILSYSSNKVFSYARENLPLDSFFLINSSIFNIPAQIAIENKLKLPCFAISSACSSSTQAIYESFLKIKNENFDIAIVGGSDSPLSEVGFESFSCLNILSQKKDPEFSCRPFDKERDGMVLGEGSACIILESLESAKKRDARIYCEILSGASLCEGFNLYSPEPTGDLISRTLQECIISASLEEKNIDHINLHGTSTIKGDLIEGKGVYKRFGKNLKTINLSAIKSMTGHTLGASGIISLISSIVFIQNEKIGPTLNFQEIDDNLANFNLNLSNKIVEKRIKYSLINSYGFGGSNCCLIIKKF